MNKNRFGFAIAIAAILCLSACTTGKEISPEPNVLKAPTLSYNNGSVSWKEIKDAEKYEVSINDEIFVTYNCYYQIPVTEQVLSYAVKVKSISQNKIDSDFSKSLTFSARLLKKITNVSMNFNHKSDEYTLSWKQTDCEKYMIYINQEKYESASTTLTTKSSDYVTGENRITVQPVGNPFDVIPEASTLIVEKSHPFTDTSNIRVENGNLIYGENNIYTEYIPDGITNNFCVSNIEENKIKSDGPICSVEKVLPPEIDTYYYGYQSMDSKTIVSVTIEVSAPLNCDKIYIELVQGNKVILNSIENGTSIGGTNGSSHYWKITFNTKGYNIPRQTDAYITACSNGCINSTTIRHSLV